MNLFDANGNYKPRDQMTQAEQAAFDDEMRRLAEALRTGAPVQPRRGISFPNPRGASLAIDGLLLCFYALAFGGVLVIVVWGDFVSGLAALALAVTSRFGARTIQNRLIAKHLEQPLTFAVLSDKDILSTNVSSREFTSWDKALAFARALAKQSPDEYITIHPRGKSDRVHYRVLSSGEVEKIDPNRYA